MMLILFGLVTVFLPSIFCRQGPFIYFNYTKFMIVQEGESPRLECYAGGDSYLPIRWHRDPLYSRRRNLTLPNGELSCYCGNVLELPSITNDQRGRYVCSTDSVWGSVSKYIKISVIFAPIILETYRVDRFESKKLELRCNVEAYPSPEIVWMKNNIILSPNIQHQIMTDYDYDNVHNSTLIVSTDSDYYGTYKCQVTNLNGHAIVIFEVTAPAVERILVSKKIFVNR